MVMELAELLEHEGLDPDELMEWADRRAATLVAELEGGDPLAALLGPGRDQVHGGRRRKPSAPQPLSAAELPPPPEQPRLAHGEPEPLLETFNTGPLELDSAEAAALIAETSTREPTADPEQSTAGDEDELEEIEFDDLLELDDDELELLEEVDDSELPSAPPPPPSSGSPALDADFEIRPGDTATDLPTPAIEDRDQPEDDEAPVQTGDTAAHPVVDTPVQTGDTAGHPVVDANPQSEDADAPREPASDDFDLDFDLDD